MADKEEVEATTPRGVDWEVVSLTASAYAAAGGNITEFKHGEKSEIINKGKVETSDALFMSGHFGLPSDPEKTEILDQHDDLESVKDLGGKPDSKEEEEENWAFKKLTELEFTENTGKEQSIYGSPTLHSLQNEATIGALNIDEETRALDEPIQSCEKTKEDNPDESWWKKQAASFYSHAKETNTFWSIFAAAAVMGIVIIGQQWQQERWQVLRHEWKSRIHDEKMRMMAGSISRFKDAIVGGNQRDFSVSGSTPREL